MKRFTSLTLATTCGLVVIANLALLAAAGWNRQGEPMTKLSLTERELAVPADKRDEDTGLDLSIVLAHEPPGMLRRMARWKDYELPTVQYDWLDWDKLIELGFRIDLDPAHPDASEYYSHRMPRRVYFVVENDGDAWARWINDRQEQIRELRQEVEGGTAEVEALKNAEAILAIDRTMRSRLFPVDAGTDADALQRRYGTRVGHAVVAGLLRPKLVRSGSGTHVLTGEVLDLAVERVHVSRDFRHHLEAFLSEETWNQIEERERRESEVDLPPPTPPRYRAVLAIGRRHEPWLVSITTLKTTEEVTR